MISLRLCALLLPLLAFAPAQDVPTGGPAPDARLQSGLRARVQDAQSLRALVRAQHLVADLRRRLRFGYIEPSELPGAVPPATLDALKELSTHAEWWARLSATQLAVE